MSVVRTAAEPPREGLLPRWKERVRNGVRGALQPVVRGLAWVGVQPDHLTILGCVLSVVAGFAFLQGQFRQGSLWLIASGACDILDGQLARAAGGETRFGAFLDSTLDRLGEAVVLMGMAGYFLLHLLEAAHNPTVVLADLARGLQAESWAMAALVAMLALVGSFLVSYTRARAEGLGLDCKVGWAERPERMIALIVAGAFGVGRVMMVMLILLTLLCFVTAAQRILHVRRILRDGSTASAGGGA